MPELPEAETIVRGLRAPLKGRTITKVRILHADLLDGVGPGAFRRDLEGRHLERIRRRGKNLVLETHRTDSDPLILVVNLGMSGRLLHRPAGATSAPPSHPGVRFHLDDGGELVYHDPRRFGRLRLLNGGDFRAWSRTLGPEPLGSAFTSGHLREGLSRTSSPLRSWLLDQRKLAGVGNIYANEALFLAGLHPAIPGREVSPPQVVALHGALRTVLRDAVRARGTTLRDYRTAQGSEGSYAVSLRVYGREGLPCPACSTAIERSVFGGRSAFHCPRCQPPPGGSTA